MKPNIVKGHAVFRTIACLSAWRLNYSKCRCLGVNSVLIGLGDGSRRVNNGDTKNRW